MQHRHLQVNDVPRSVGKIAQIGDVAKPMVDWWATIDEVKEDVAQNRKVGDILLDPPGMGF
jgi:hypothetical protein